jgi:signal transduction histidine kinase
MATPSSSSAGQGPPRTRSIRLHMTARLAVPATALVVLCVETVMVALNGPLAMPALRGGVVTPQQRSLDEAAALAGVATLVAVGTFALAVGYSRRLSREIADLTQAARNLATEQLPRVIQDLREGAPASGPHATQAARRTLDAEWMAGRLRKTKTTEIVAAAQAITGIERTAFEAAAAEARLRDGLRSILMSLGRRNQSLLHRQLKIIDHLEQQAISPGELADLFTLDHITTRMRRQAESLTVLSGASPVRSWSAPVPVIDVIRAAVAEIEDYKRVTVATDSEESVAASAVTDMIHLLAELIENATLFSPSATRVEVRAERVANGFAIEVEDRGLGIAAGELKEINERLASPPDFDLADADRLGLFVAGRLAARQGVAVQLIQSAYHGIRAVVVLPDGLMTTSAGQPEGDSVLRGAARLDVQSPGAMSLAGAMAPPPAATGPVAAGPTVTGGAAPGGSHHSLGDLAGGVRPQRSAEPRDAEPRHDERRPEERRSAEPGGEAGGGRPRWDGLPAAQAPPRLDSGQVSGQLPRRQRPAQPADGGASGTELPAAMTQRRLPRRVRPGSPAQLATDTPVHMPGTARPAEAPAPERARNLAAALQSSWLRSREASSDISVTELEVPGAPDTEEMLWLTATQQAGPARATSPGSLMTWPPGSTTSARRCCCPVTDCSSPPRRTCPGRTRSTCRRWRRPCSRWRQAPASGLTRAGSVRRSSSWNGGCSS